MSGYPSWLENEEPMKSPLSLFGFGIVGGRSLVVAFASYIATSAKEQAPTSSGYVEHKGTGSHQDLEAGDFLVPRWSWKNLGSTLPLNI